MGKARKALPYRKAPVGKYRGNEGDRKSPGKHHSNGCYIDMDIWVKA